MARSSGWRSPCWLAQEPKLLLLDEPVAGMTRRERDRTGELLHAISAARSTLVVEHDMEFVAPVRHTVTVLHGGKVAVRGPVSIRCKPMSA